MTTTPTPKARRGFAAMDPEKRREIARKGGHAQRKRSFLMDPGLASRAGKLGGLASAAARKARRETVDA